MKYLHCGKMFRPKGPSSGRWYKIHKMIYIRIYKIVTIFRMYFSILNIFTFIWFPSLYFMSPAWKWPFEFETCCHIKGITYTTCADRVVFYFSFNSIWSPLRWTSVVGTSCSYSEVSRYQWQIVFYDGLSLYCKVNIYCSRLKSLWVH